MKTCAYCYEEIQDKAIMCRYCTKPVLLDALRISYVGQWYAAGRTPSGYAIWNMVTGGTPVIEVDLTDEAWKRAWKEYQKLERPPSNVTWMVGGFFPLDF